MTTFGEDLAWGLSFVFTNDGEIAWIGEFGDIGLRRGALDEDEDKAMRVKSRLKLERRESGGNGEELFCARDWISGAGGLCDWRPSSHS
jgi:hypothetical protein